MTAFFIDLSKPQRALVASDSLGYTVTGERHEPLGFATKVMQVPHLRGAFFGSGLYDIQVRTFADLLLYPELITYEHVVEMLPHLLHKATRQVARERDIEDPDGLILFCAGWLGWSEAAGKCELTLFQNDDGYAPRVGFTGMIGIPNCSAEYLPPGFHKLPQEPRAAAAMRAVQRFIVDHGEALGQPPIGGSIIVTEVSRHGVSSREVGKFGDYQRTLAAIEATWERVARGGVGAGVDLVHAAADRDQAMARVLASVRAQRRAA